MASHLGDTSSLEPPSAALLETQAPSRKANRKGGLPEAKRKGRAKRLNKDTEDLVSSMQQLDLAAECTVPVGTGLVWDERMMEFHCLWDESFPECPERLAAIREKLLQWDLLERCVPVMAREISEDEILLAHSQEYLALMKSTERMSEAELRSLSDAYDSVYLHPSSYRCACLAAGSVLQLVEKVLAGELRNGLAVVRPPGHHAQHNKMDGYCMFNNLGIAAQYARQKLGVERVLIVDWDVHHGQGTQYLFEDSPSVLYFSVHRYEEGSFWPHLPESNSHAVGKGRGEGYNINVPWNQIGMRDADYLSAFLHILLPVAFEFQPQLVLVAAGFDSVIGDPKGEMAVSPGCFAHLTHLLMPLAGGKLVLSLEGGYNLQSLAEGTCAALKTLLGDPCPPLASPHVPCSSGLHSVSQTLAAHCKYWKNLRRISADLPQEGNGDAGVALSTVMEILPMPAADPMRPLPPARTGLVYDEKMTEHYNMWDSLSLQSAPHLVSLLLFKPSTGIRTTRVLVASQHPELPQRVSKIFQRHSELHLTERCCRLPARLASEEELQMCHSLAYIEAVKSTATMKPRDLHRQGSQYNSIYICTSSYKCARLAAGSAFSAVEAVLSGKVQNAVAIVRPPGHHAESDAACGFCFFNSVALAARYAQHLAGRTLRVMILDWDVHHGNGTQHMFEDDPSVLYVSLHRYDKATFFPTSEDADYDRVGSGPGEGFTVNVPWNCPRMGDAEYLAAFHRIVLPVAYEFNPELVLVSAGFDAARGDPLGGCLVTPECYAHMTHLLLGLAGGKVALVLEGGYNLQSISESMTMCTRSLLGDPPPALGRLKAPHPSALQSLARVAVVHRRYWASLRLEVPVLVQERPRTRAGKGTPFPGDIPTGGTSEQLASPVAQPLEAVEDAVIALSSLHLEENPTEVDETAFSSHSPDSSPEDGAVQKDRGSTKGAEPAEDSQTGSTTTGSPDRVEPAGERQTEGTSVGSPEGAEPAGESQTEGTSVGSPEGAEPAGESQTEGTSLGSPEGAEPAGESQTEGTSLGSPEGAEPAGESQTEGTSVGSPEGAEPAGESQTEGTSVGSPEGAEPAGESQTEGTSLGSPEGAEPAGESQTEGTSVGSPEGAEPAGESQTEGTSVGSPEGAEPAGESHTEGTSVGSPEGAEPAGESQRISASTGSSSGNMVKFAKDTRVNPSVSPSMQIEVILLDEATGGCSSSCELLEEDLADGELFYAVTPLPWCPHLDLVLPVPSTGLNVLEPCMACGSQTENWVCLICYKVCCGRYINRHMVAHNSESGHPLVLSFEDLSVWCYGCQAYVHHPTLFDAKSQAHKEKFGTGLTVTF